MAKELILCGYNWSEYRCYQKMVFRNSVQHAIIFIFCWLQHLSRGAIVVTWPSYQIAFNTVQCNLLIINYLCFRDSYRKWGIAQRDEEIRSPFIKRSRCWQEKSWWNDPDRDYYTLWLPGESGRYKRWYNVWFKDKDAVCYS